MASSLYDQYVRAHPAYKAGLALGTDIGTRIALDIIWAEWSRQVDAAIAADSGNSTHPRPHAYTAGRLYAVAQIVGAHFRQAAS